MNQKIHRKRIEWSLCLLVLLLFLLCQKEKSRQTESAKINQETETLWQEETQTESIQEKNAGQEQMQLVIPGGNPAVRVWICGDTYQSACHSSLRMVCSTDYTVAYGDVVEEHQAKEPVWFTMEDVWLTYGKVTLTPKEEGGEWSFPELKRSQESPSYAGVLEVAKTEEGLRLINQLPLETYLCSVVSSEMPSDYPLEALKAQAICARTYALKQMKQARDEGRDFDVDDSVSYQVYNNVAANERTCQAVEETKGQVMMRNGELLEALYYSTSCGLELAEDLSTEAVFASFMTGEDGNAWEKEEAWYRWKTAYTLEELTALAQTGGYPEIGRITSMEIVSREKNGRAARLTLQGEHGSAVVEGEYTIRKLLQTAEPVVLQDGNTAPDLGMLPSAFFYLMPQYEGGVLSGYEVIGGGYGHGTGMSQNGARHMADAGRTCEEILRFYYQESMSAEIN